MSAATSQLPPRAVYTDEPVYRLTVEQYHDLIDRGILTADDPVELIEGVLVHKMSKNEPHIAAGRRCRRAIERMLPATHFYETEQPITLSDGEPEPDGMIVRGSIEDFDKVRVRPNDAMLVIEIADSTLDRDRGIKLQSYARAGVGCYWIVNLVDREIEVYTEPEAAIEICRFRRTEAFRAGQVVPLSIDGRAIGEIRVNDLLPPA